MIDGVVITPLKRIGDERGMVLHMLRRDWDVFENFGEIYFSMINPRVVKGWKKHLKMNQHFAVPVGNVRLVIYDDRDDSSSRGETDVLNLGIDHYQLVRVPPLVWYALGALGDQQALVANCTDLPHDPQETLTADLDDPRVPYDWKLELT